MAEPSSIAVSLTGALIPLDGKKTNFLIKCAKRSSRRGRRGDVAGKTRDEAKWRSTSSFKEALSSSFSYKPTVKKN